MGHTTLNEERRAGPTASTLDVGRCHAKVGERKLLNYTYIDNSNVFFEGQRIAAVKKGLVADIFEARSRKVFDLSWRIDYGKLHDLACGNQGEVGAAKLWGSIPPGDSFWNRMAESRGFEVKVFERTTSGHEKKVDVAIAHQLTKDAYTIIDKAVSEITLVAGDKDYVPVVEDLVSGGYQVVVFFWDHATARELQKVASSYVPLDKWHGHLGL